MIESRRSPAFANWFGRQAHKRMAKSFAAVRIFGLERMREAIRSGPTLVVSNHTSWWDPMFTIVLSTRWVAMEGYSLMETRNLLRHPFLGRVGGFGVDLDDPEDGARVLRYAARLLDRPGRLVWIYPQGTERPLTEPLVFKPGAAVVARLAKVERVLPCAFRYEFAEQERPYLYASFGSPVCWQKDVDAATEQFRAAVAGELERIDRTIRAASVGAEPERRPTELLRSMPGWLARLAEWVLALLTRY